MKKRTGILLALVLCLAAICIGAGAEEALYELEDKGTLTSYSEYTGKNVAKCPHYGMLLFTRDSSAPLSPDIWAAGFFLRTATKAWKESVPFNILAEEVDRDWSEAEIPSGDGE